MDQAKDWTQQSATSTFTTESFLCLCEFESYSNTGDFVKFVEL